MRVLVTGGTGHSGSYIIPELIAAGHEVAALARSDTAAAAVSALGATVRRGELQNLDGLREAASDSDGVIHVAHSTTDRAGFLPTLIALAKEKGVAGRYWHAVSDGGIPLREIAKAIGGRLGLPAVRIPTDELMVPGHFGFLANIVTQSYPASNLITRRTLGWEPTQPGLLADPDNGHYFPAG
ncbi:MAG TPA: NAD(P)H-binding protein [Gryllotalpicola sp.]